MKAYASMIQGLGRLVRSSSFFERSRKNDMRHGEVSDSLMFPRLQRASRMYRMREEARVSQNQTYSGENSCKQREVNG